MFKKSFIGLVASVAMSAVALGVSAQESRADHAPTYDWTGPYIGAIIGIGSIEGTADIANSGSGTLPLSDSGFMGGLTVGWNAQDGHLVYGIEGDVSFGEVDATAFPFGLTGPTVTVDTDLFATIRGRAGVAADDIFLYGTAGLAILDGDVSGDFGSSSFTAFGGVVGAGAERSITQDVSFKAELLYAFFDEDVGLGRGDSVNIDEFYTVRFGVNWHF